MSFDRDLFDKAKDAMIARGAESLLKYLKLDYVSAGNVLFVQPGANSPAKGSDSFAVYDVTGTFKDFRDGPQGDYIDLIGRVLHLDKQIEALKEAHAYLGWGEVTTQRAVTPAERAAWEKQRQAKAKAAAEAAAKKETACAAKYLDKRAVLPGAGSPVQAYQEGRGADFELTGGFPNVLRFEPEARFYYGRDDYEVHPAQTAAMYRDGRIVALHRTFLGNGPKGKAILRPMNSGKARSAKRMYGSPKGAVIPLFKGKGRLPYGEALKRGLREVVCLAEGTENGVTAAMAQPDYRTWAAGSKANMMALDWPETAEAVVLVRDNDGDTEEEQAEAFEQVRKHWERLRGNGGGRVLHVGIVPANIKDINDWLNSDD